MGVFGPINTGTTSGGAGASTANATSTTRACGYIWGVYVQYNGSPPAGSTDIVVKTVGTSPASPSFTILSISDAATDGLFLPRAPLHDTSGAAISSQYDLIPVDDYINVLIDDANDGDSATVWLYLATDE